jgi:DNA-directed RNA polymerase subunit N (RpoN/RPB10)
MIVEFMPRSLVGSDFELLLILLGELLRRQIPPDIHSCLREVVKEFNTFSARLLQLESQVGPDVFDELNIRGLCVKLRRYLEPAE